MEDNDAQLQQKKRARRRLVGAIFFVSVVAVLLPVGMDHEPRQTGQDVEVRIPGQEEKPAVPAVVAPEAKPAAEVAKPAVRAPESNKDAKAADKPTEKPAAKPEKAPEKPAAKPAEKPADKAQEKAKADEAKRAAAILAGHQGEAKTESKPAAKGEYLVLIGAFANEANVKILKTKLSEQGIKTFSEPLDTPQGKKTRVRAGPFPSREAAEKALEKMRGIGVSGVVAAKP